MSAPSETDGDSSNGQLTYADLVEFAQPRSEEFEGSAGEQQMRRNRRSTLNRFLTYYAVLACSPCGSEFRLLYNHTGVSRRRIRSKIDYWIL